MTRILVLFLVIIGFWGLPSLVFAYDETYTHPYLTKLIIGQWEQTSGFVLSPADQALIIAGSVAEDNPHARSLNHFYNPLNRQGLSINEMLVGYATPDWLGSKSQQSEPLFMGSFTWGEGLTAYKTGDRERALAILGHSLHLLEDMALPAHTRNDQHVDGDSYESWVKEQNSISGQELSWDSKLWRQVTCAREEDCLRALAKFTNANFFSADTIYDKNFSEPKKSAMLYYDGYARAHGRVVAFYDKTAKTLILNSQVHRANWRALTPELISYGVKMMDLFLTAEPKPDQPVKKAITPRISAGGVKIKADDDTLFLNQGSGALKPMTSDRWWPIIDLSRIIPREFLGSTPPTFNQPQVAGVKIVSESEPIVTTNSGSTSTPDLPPPPIDPPPPPPPVDPPATTTPPIIIPDIEAPVPSDTEGPQANFIDLANSYPDASWTLNWQGLDNISSSANLLFDVDFKLSSDWTSHLASTTATSSIYAAPLADGTTVNFRVRATDEAGNVGAWQEASTSYIEPNRHNPLIYEKLEHLYHFSECSGTLARDTIAGSNMTIRIPWITGPWDCGVEQDWLEANYMDAMFDPLTTSELTLAFYMRDVSDFEIAYSCNRLWLADATQGFTILQIKPTTQNIRIATNRPYDYYGVWDRLLAAKMPLDHNWHSVFLTVNQNYLALYIDGVLAEQLDGDFSPTRAIRHLTIVGENSPTQFDEIALWSRSLSSDEIRDYYNVAKPLKPNLPL